MRSVAQVSPSSGIVSTAPSDVIGTLPGVTGSGSGAGGGIGAGIGAGAGIGGGATTSVGALAQAARGTSSNKTSESPIINFFMG